VNRMSLSATLLAVCLGGCSASTTRSNDTPTTPSTTSNAPPEAVDRAEAEADAFTQHVKALQARTPEAFTIVIAKPFVVIGDEAPERVAARARGTVQWATSQLKAQYFDRNPEAIIDVWLFKDAASYEKHTMAFWGERPGTPYGYYSSRHDALIMNIATGGGTLVHEMVHPFMESNFPECPSWFNEGLASLYEQCGEEDGRVHGYTNWRLAGLQEAIRAGELPWFKDLMATTEDGFYEEDPGTNYGQARYLCYYLQHKGLLQRYYREFVANSEDDPTGYATLQRVLGVRNMEQFQKEWEAWVLTLRYP